MTSENLIAKRLFQVFERAEALSLSKPAPYTIDRGFSRSLPERTEFCTWRHFLELGIVLSQIFGALIPIGLAERAFLGPCVLW
jgi:hypothetical protein